MGLFNFKHIRTISISLFVTASMPLAASWFGNSDNKTLSKSDIEKIDQGQGSHEQNSQYIQMCVEDNACRYGLIQAWSNDTSEHSLDAVAKTMPPQKNQALFDGTDIGRMMHEYSLVLNCNLVPACQENLLEITKIIRSVPDEMLQAAYKDKTQLDKDKFTRVIQNKIISAVKSSEDKAQYTPPSTLTDNSARSPSTYSSDKVIDFYLDPYNNDKNYLKSTASGNLAIFYYPEGNKAREHKIADILGESGHYLIETVTGETVDAKSYHLTNKGFIATGRDKLYGYTINAGLAQYTSPVGFHAAEIQMGDAYKTGYMLLERDTATDRVNKLGSNLSALGALLGVNKKEDYALIDLHTGKLFPLNIAYDGKTQLQMYNCRKKNDFFNICKSAVERETLFNKFGLKNYEHYVWRIQWFRTPEATYLIAREEGKAGLSATRLEDGKKARIAYRTLGIADWEAGQHDSGKIWVDVRLTFNKERYTEDLDSDFNTFLTQTTVEKPVKKETLSTNSYLNSERN